MPTLNDTIVKYKKSEVAGKLPGAAPPGAEQAESPGGLLPARAAGGDAAAHGDVLSATPPNF